MSNTPEQVSALLRRPADELQALAYLDETATQQLMTDITRAHELHEQHMRDSIEDAIQHVPRLLRGTFRKLIKGK